MGSSVNMVSPFGARLVLTFTKANHADFCDKILEQTEVIAGLDLSSTGSEYRF